MGLNSRSREPNMPGALSRASASACANKPCSMTEGWNNSLLAPTPATLRGALHRPQAFLLGGFLFTFFVCIPSKRLYVFVRLGNLCHPMVHVIRWLQACCCVSVLVLAVFFSLVYKKMLWHIRFFEFVFLGLSLVCCM